MAKLEMKDMVKRKNTLKTKKTIRGEGEITYHEKKEKKFQEEKAEIQSDGDKKSTSIPFKWRRDSSVIGGS